MLCNWVGMDFQDLQAGLFVGKGNFCKTNKGTSVFSKQYGSNFLGYSWVSGLLFVFSPECNKNSIEMEMDRFFTFQDSNIYPVPPMTQMHK